MGVDVCKDDQLAFLTCSRQSVAQPASSGSACGPCELQSGRQKNEEHNN